MAKINVKINLSWLKIIGTIVVIVGLWGFVYGMLNNIHVVESGTVIGMGLGTLGYRKHLISKANEKSNVNAEISK